MNLEVTQTVYLLIRGFDYEGSGVLSVHRSEQGARDAADTFMNSGECQQFDGEGWEEAELHPTHNPVGLAAEWHCGSQYLEIRTRTLQE